MKKYFIQYRLFLLFLGKFFLAFVLLTFIYKMYLNSFGENNIDSITEFVAYNTKNTLQLIDNQSYLIHNNTKNYIQIFYQNKYVSRIIEGCNGISVIILFISFIFAFSGKWKQTVVFMVNGSIIIYTLNVFRIALLSVLLFHYPKYEHVLHGVVFPLIIYGVVFILWVIWVNKFSNFASKSV